MAAWFTDEDWQKCEDIACYEYCDGELRGIWKIKKQLYLYEWNGSTAEYYEYFLFKLNKTDLDQINHDRSIKQFIIDNQNTNCQIVRVRKDEHLLGLRKPTKKDLSFVVPIFDKIDSDFLTEKKLPKDKLFFE